MCVLSTCPDKTGDLEWADTKWPLPGKGFCTRKCPRPPGQHLCVERNVEGCAHTELGLMASSSPMSRSGLKLCRVTCSGCGWLVWGAPLLLTGFPGSTSDQPASGFRDFSSNQLPEENGSTATLRGKLPSCVPGGPCGAPLTLPGVTGLSSFLS